MPAIYTTTQNVQTSWMRLLEALLNRILIEVVFALAYVGVVGWAGLGFVTMLLDRFIELMNQSCVNVFGSMSA